MPDGGQSTLARNDFVRSCLGLAITSRGAPDSTTTPTTIDPTTAGPGTSETGTGTETGTTTTTTDPTETTSTSTTESTSTSTTDSTTTTTSTTDTTDTTTGTSGGPMEGGDCSLHFDLACDAGPGVVGNVLRCEDTKWVVRTDLLCDDPSKCGETGLTNPQVVGCMGTPQSWYCACADTPKSECSMGMQSQCGEAVGDDVKVELCVEDAGKTYYYVSVCPNCEEVDGEPLCLLR